MFSSGACAWAGMVIAGFCCFSPIVEDAAAIDLRIGQNFAGARSGIESDAVPSDATGAAGPEHFVEFVNGRFSVYEKATAKRVQTRTDIQFWNAAGVTFTSTVGTTDPRMIFDPDSQRWFGSMVSYTINSPRQRSNRFLLAVSASSDPTGNWSGFSIASDPNSVNFADFPTLGVDQAAVYLSGDMFDRNGNPVGPSLFAIPKKSLLATPATLDGRTYLGRFSYGARGNILQPAATIGRATTPESVLAVSDVGIDFQPLNTLVLSQILDGGMSNTATLSSPSVVLDVPLYSVPINPPQPDGTATLDDGDARLGSTVKRVGDILYATHAVQVDNRAAVRWYRIDAARNTLIETGTIADPDLDLFYPSIAANEAGTAVIGCNGSSEQTYVSSYAVAGEVINGKLTFGKLTLLKAGRASYQNTDASGTSRWGDYSATTLDPADPNRFWTIQMIAASRSSWATQITELIAEPVAGTRLTVSRVGTTVVISWPLSETGFQLESSPTLAPAPAWAPATQTAGVTNNIATIVLPGSDAQSFFRLAPAAAP